MNKKSKGSVLLNVVLIVALVICVLIISGKNKKIESLTDEVHSYMYSSNDDFDFDDDDDDEEEETTKKKEESTTKKQKEESTTKKKKEETTKKSSGVDPDLKKVLDGYEKFVNEYVDFMKEYTDNPSLEAVAKYGKMMSDYAKHMDEIDDIDEDELSDEDYAYYIDVTARVSKKLLEVQ